MNRLTSKQTSRLFERILGIFKEKAWDENPHMYLSIYKMNIIFVCFNHVPGNNYCENDITTVKVLWNNMYFYTIWEDFISWIDQTTWYLTLRHILPHPWQSYPVRDTTVHSCRSRIELLPEIYTQVPKYSNRPFVRNDGIQLDSLTEFFLANSFSK